MAANFKDGRVEAKCVEEPIQYHLKQLVKSKCGVGEMVQGWER